MFNLSMLKNLPLFIGLRYTRSRRKEGFVSFISGFSLCAMALGVAALIIVLSVMNGFDQEIKNRILKVVPHISVSDKNGFSNDQLAVIESQIMTDKATESFTPMVQSFVMVSSDESQVGVNLQGIDPSWIATELLKQSMLSGYVEQLVENEFNIIIGSQIARKMDLFIGDEVQLTLPKITVTPVGVFPRIKRATVSGIFEVGAQVDGSLVFIHERDAQMLLRLGERYQGFHIQLKDAFDADNWIENQAKIIFPQYQWRSWISSMGTLFKAMSMEKIIVSFLLSVIIAVAAFNIVASLVLMVSDKRKDIAVMRTMGADSLLISKVFIMQGMSVGVIGILIGVVTGSSVAYFIGDIIGFFEKISGLYLFDPSIYLISVLPSEILVYDILRIICGALVISFLATLYPAWRAGQILPAEALRYDQ